MAYRLTFRLWHNPTPHSVDCVDRQTAEELAAWYRAAGADEITITELITKG